MSNIIVECVPNISEGRDTAKINRIVDAARLTGVKILGVEPDPDYNRTVITFAGEPQTVEEAAIQLILKSIEEIDMRMHSGEHPRMGCVDVCPFIPIRGITMEIASILLSELLKNRRTTCPSFPIWFLRPPKQEFHCQRFVRENMKD